MTSQQNLDRAYMECAYAMSKLSHANRKKVGAIIVASHGGIIAEGVNGTPSGFDNECEEEKFNSICIDLPVSRYKPLIVTKPEVLHAESNAITKVAKSTNSSQGATLYCTLTPCFHCAKLIIQAGIVRVVYNELYPIDDNSGQNSGLDLLAQAKIEVDNLGLHQKDTLDIDFQDEGRGYDPDQDFR